MAIYKFPVSQHEWIPGMRTKVFSPKIVDTSALFQLITISWQLALVLILGMVSVWNLKDDVLTDLGHTVHIRVVRPPSHRGLGVSWEKIHFYEN